MDIKTLIAVATGKIPHNYRSGLCPDELQPDSRDPDCPACKILIEAVTEHDAMERRLREAEALTAAARDVLAERRRRTSSGGAARVSKTTRRSKLTGARPWPAPLSRQGCRNGRRRPPFPLS